VTAEIKYSTQHGGTAHHYRLADGQLTYWCGDSGLEFRLNLQPGECAVKPKWQFHRFWYVGLVGLSVPLFTFGMIYLKEGIIDVGGVGWFHLGILVAGAILLVVYRKPRRVYEVRTGRGDRLLILADPAQPGAAEYLAEAVRSQNGA
jgi:hypothetical protein